MPPPPLPGQIRQVSSGRTVVAVTMDDGKVWLRSGVGQDTPGGQQWIRLHGKMKQVTDFFFFLHLFHKIFPTQT